MTGAAPPLVLVPGLLCTASLFAPQVAALGSKTAVSVAEHIHQDSMAGLARHILAAAPAAFALAGLSMGGAIAFEILRQAPERVIRLALLNTRAGLDSEEAAASRRFYIDLARSGRFSEITREHLLPRLVHPARRDDQMLVDTIIGMAEETGPEAFIRQETALLDRPDNRPLLSAIRCPTLVVVGDADAITPLSAAKEIVSGIPDAKLEVLQRCGHLSSLECPAEVTALLAAWLRA
jgi:pimeloyl-ACP methyl ester carboxylesterase